MRAFLVCCLCLVAGVSFALTHREEIQRGPFPDKAGLLAELDRAGADLREGRTADGEVRLRKLAESRLVPSAVHYLLALQHFSRRQFPEANERALAAVHCNTNNADNKGLAAMTFYLLGDHAKGKAYADAALAMPELSEYYRKGLAEVTPVSARGNGVNVFLKSPPGTVTAILVLLLSIILHEIAHGWMALRMGDPTARDLGRLTLNPLKHIDPVGTILLPGLLALAQSSVIFGWAKPVPFNPANFRQPRRASIFVALAGPASNVLLMLCGVLVMKVGFAAGAGDALLACGLLLVLTNIVLVVLNLLPIPPLDGHHVVANLLPKALAAQYVKIGAFGFILVFLLMQSPFFNGLVQGAVRFVGRTLDLPVF